MIKKKTIVFSGHMIDAPGRKKPRFPQSIEPQVRALLIQELARLQPIALGIAGAASGGDILFHECCLELGIKSQIVLAGEIRDFLASSVEVAGGDWPARYHKLTSSLPMIVLQNSGEGLNSDIFSKANARMIEEAQKFEQTTHLLLVLLDESQAGKTGGTAEMVSEAAEAGFAVKKIDISPLNSTL